MTHRRYSLLSAYAKYDQYGGISTDTSRYARFETLRKCTFCPSLGGFDKIQAGGLARALSLLSTRTNFSKLGEYWFHFAPCSITKCYKSVRMLLENRDKSDRFAGKPAGSQNKSLQVRGMITGDGGVPKIEIPAGQTPFS